jgi:hypothetical protein
METVITMPGRSRRTPAHGYQVTVYTSSSEIGLTPSALVDRSGLYRPSEQLDGRLEDMWNYRRPNVIGSVSESMATEVLCAARLNFEGTCWLLVPERLRSFLRVSAGWKPNYGIYYDDLIAVAEGDGDQCLFLVEVKGTTQKTGLPHASEAKIFYQLATTHHILTQKQAVKQDLQRLRIGGVIRIVILHLAKAITLNVLDEKTAGGFFPDAWMYPGEST